MDEFKLVSRRALIVYMKQLKYVKQLRRYGSIQYVSRKMKYVVLYVNESEIEQIQKEVETLRGVIKVDISQRPDIKTEYETGE